MQGAAAARRSGAQAQHAAAGRPRRERISLRRGGGRLCRRAAPPAALQASLHKKATERGTCSLAAAAAVPQPSEAPLWCHAGSEGAAAPVSRSRPLPRSRPALYTRRRCRVLLTRFAPHRGSSAAYSVPRCRATLSHQHQALERLLILAAGGAVLHPEGRLAEGSSHSAAHRTSRRCLKCGAVLFSPALISAWPRLSRSSAAATLHPALLLCAAVAAAGRVLRLHLRRRRGGSARSSLSREALRRCTRVPHTRQAAHCSRA